MPAEEKLRRVVGALKNGVEREGILVDTIVLGRALELLAVLPDDLPLPEIVVESEHEIGFDWDQGSRGVVAVTVDETAFLGFATLFGGEPMHGRIPFAGETPPMLLDMICRSGSALRTNLEGGIRGE